MKLKILALLGAALINFPNVYATNYTPLDDQYQDFPQSSSRGPKLHADYTQKYGEILMEILTKVESGPKFFEDLDLPNEASKAGIKQIAQKLLKHIVPVLKRTPYSFRYLERWDAQYHYFFRRNPLAYSDFLKVFFYKLGRDVPELMPESIKGRLEGWAKHIQDLGISHLLN